jgi:hypothetical protein
LIITLINSVAHAILLNFKDRRKLYHFSPIKSIKITLEYHNL